MSITLNGTDLSGITLNGTDLSEVILNGTSVWESEAEWNTRGLEYNSWKTIQRVIKAGEASSRFAVGDTKTFVIGNKTYTAEVVRINNGSGTSGPHYYPDKTVDFITKELYETKYQYHSEVVTAGDKKFTFVSSDIKNTLNEVIYPLLPYGLRNVIIDKKHAYNGYMAGYSGVEIGITKLWLPSEGEIHDPVPSSDERKYTISSKIKSINGGSSSDWWLSDCVKKSGVETAEYTSTTGGLKNEHNYTLTKGVPICFRIGEPLE